VMPSANPQQPFRKFKSHRLRALRSSEKNSRLLAHKLLLGGQVLYFCHNH